MCPCGRVVAERLRKSWRNRAHRVTPEFVPPTRVRRLWIRPLSRKSSCDVSSFCYRRGNLLSQLGPEPQATTERAASDHRTASLGAVDQPRLADHGYICADQR